MSEVEQTEAQERKAAEAAFATASDEAPVKAATEAPEKKEETVVEKVEPAVEKKPDPWEGVPVVVRTTLEGINGKLKSVDALAQSAKTWDGRIAAIQKVQSELSAAQSIAKKTPDAPTQAQIEAAAQSVKGWEDLKEFNPGWAAAIDARIAAERAEMLKQVPAPADVKPQLETLSAGLRKSMSEEIAASRVLTREFARLDAKYPDWEAEINTPEFSTWNAAQPPEIRALADSDKAKDAIKMMDAFTEYRKREAERQKNQQRLETAIPAKGTPGQRQPTTTEREAAEKAFASA